MVRACRPKSGRFSIFLDDLLLFFAYDCAILPQASPPKHPGMPLATMNILSCSAIRQIEADAIAGVDAFGLMENAARQIADAIKASYPVPGRCIAYAGTGNNGGDALSVARQLAAAGWTVQVRLASAPEQLGELARRQWGLLQAAAGSGLLPSGEPPLPQPGPAVLLDGLLGSGAHGELRGRVADLCAEINALRLRWGQAAVWAVDVPTGLDAETGDADPQAVRADVTAAIACVKPGMLADEASPLVGRLVCVPLAGLDIPASPDAVLDSDMLSPLLTGRPRELYKNSAGRVAVIAGSVGMLGAARLCSEAALRAGAGLVVLYCLPDSYPLLAASAAPEIMVKRVASYREIDEEDARALLIGPGLGQLPPIEQMALHATVSTFDGTVVLDADGLNMAAERGWSFGGNVILTPHLGEMRRLLHEHVPLPRCEMARRFLNAHDATLVLKGARTLIATRQGYLFNSSGGPAMATAGEGDVLAGTCAGLAAQGMAPRYAAALAVYACGVASDLACRTADGRSLTAGGTLAKLGAAFRAIAWRTPVAATLP